jgi:hypothetical protein
MSERAAESISRDEGRRSLLLWFAVLAGPAAWATQLVVNYSLEEIFACSPGVRTEGEILGIPVTAFALAVTGVLAVMALAAGIVSVGCYRRTRSLGDDDTSDRSRWMAVVGVMNSVLYFLIVLVSFAPPLILGICETSP